MLNQPRAIMPPIPNRVKYTIVCMNVKMEQKINSKFTRCTLIVLPDWSNYFITGFTILAYINWSKDICIICAYCIRIHLNGLLQYQLRISK